MKHDLKSTNTRAARSEAQSRFPEGGKLIGYADDEVVYISAVRKRGDRAHVATAVRNDSPVPTRFVLET